MKKKDKEIFNTQFPIVKNVSAKTIGMDIFPYIPGDKKNNKIWEKYFKKLYKKIKADFDAKGIPTPKVVIDRTKGPITYGIKTTDKDGNILHSQP